MVGTKEIMLAPMCMLTGKRMEVSPWKEPMLPWNLYPEKPDWRKLMVTTETMEQKNVCQPRVWFQKEDTSSIANRRPPTGAPNAALTPAAAPAEIKSRLSRGSRNMLNKSRPRVRERPWLMPAPVIAPM